MSADPICPESPALYDAMCRGNLRFVPLTHLRDQGDRTLADCTERFLGDSARRPINDPVAPQNHDIRDGLWRIFSSEAATKSPAMLLAEWACAGFAVAMIAAIMFTVQSCARESDAREIGCAIRWSHAANVNDSLTAASRCGSTGLVKRAVKP